MGGAPGATSGPLFPSNMTLQESNWNGPIFICGFCVAAKLAFPDRPLTPRGPKKGQKGPFGATHVKNGIDRLEANAISVVLPLGIIRIDEKTARYGPFFAE